MTQTGSDTRHIPEPMTTAPAPSRLRTAVDGVTGSWRRAQRALLLHVVLRLVGVGVLAVWAHRRGQGLHELLASRWDAVFYLQIAEHGYSTQLIGGCPTGGPTCKLAFFPLYPMLIRGTSSATGLPAGWVGWGIAVIASVLAAWGIFAVAEKLYGSRTALFTVVLYAIVPHALVQSMAYTEPVLIALAAWSLYAVLNRYWLTAGLLALFAGLTRPSGAAVVAAVILAAAWQLRPARLARRAHAARAPSSGRRPTGRLWAAIVLAPVGWFAFFAFVGHRMGRWDGYFEEQRLWGTTFDGGVFTAETMAGLFTSRVVFLEHVVVAATLVSAVVLLILCARARLPAAVLIYAAVLLLIALGGAGFFHAKARFLLPAFPLLFPLASAMARAHKSTVYWTLATATLASAVYGGYLALVWTHSY